MLGADGFFLLLELRDLRGGLLRVAIASLDFETTPSYTLVITATDDGTPPHVHVLFTTDGHVRW